MVMFILIFTIVGILSKGISALEDPCPPSRDVYPCYCDTDYTGYSFLYCDKVNDIKRIGEVLQVIKGRNISLSFEKVRFGAIDSNFFQGQIASDVNFDHCDIHSFGDRPFSGMEETLQKIYIYGSVDKRKKDLKTFPLSHLRKLRSVSFLGNDIVKLGNEWFDGGPVAVEELSLEANDIEVLGDKAFASLVNLRQIWIGDNRFGVIKRSMFANPAPKLAYMEFGFNGIETIPEDMFVGMPSLERVSCTGNKLVTIPVETWGHVWNNLTEVYLERNRLECDGRLKWIFQRKLPKIFTGTCSGSNALRGKDLKDLTEKDFDFFLKTVSNHRRVYDCKID